MEPMKILIIDDGKTFYDDLRAIHQQARSGVGAIRQQAGSEVGAFLQQAGYHVVTSPGGLEALHSIGREKPALIIVGPTVRQRKSLLSMLRRIPAIAKITRVVAQ